MANVVESAVGFAADPHGSGVAYVRVGASDAAPVLRVPFTVKRYPALLEREVGYAALAAVSHALLRRGVQRVRFTLEDARVVADLQEHRDVPPALTMAYVRLGCALNQFGAYEIAASPQPELRSRALSEVAMHVAA